MRGISSAARSVARFSASCPGQAALLRLAGAVLGEIHDEWQVSDRRYLSEKSMTMLANPKPPEPANRTDQIKQEVAHPAQLAS